MTQQEDFVINKPYVPTEEEAQAIAELELKGLEPHDWESGKAGVTSFKGSIREFLYNQQYYKCAYCRIDIPDTCFYPIDHIAPKSKYQKWLFEPKNLCISCERCNSQKKDTDVLRTHEEEGYPNRKEDFNIINPYLDRYSDHINIEEDLIYRGITQKGRFTIETCGLSRLPYVIVRAKAKMEKNNPESIKMQILSLINNDSEYNREKVKERLDLVVNVYNNRMR